MFPNKYDDIEKTGKDPEENFNKQTADFPSKRFTDPQETTMYIDNSVKPIGRVTDIDNRYGQIEERLGRKLQDYEKSQIDIAAAIGCKLGVSNGGVIAYIIESPYMEYNGVNEGIIYSTSEEVAPETILSHYEKILNSKRLKKNLEEIIYEETEPNLSPIIREPRHEIIEEPINWSGIFDDVPETLDSSTAGKTSGSSKK